MGRLLGIHWGVPFQNTLGKANDLLINSYTLDRLLSSSKPAIREAALANAEKRGYNSSVLCRTILTGDFPEALKEKVVKAITIRVGAYLLSRPNHTSTELERNDDVGMLANLPPAAVQVVHPLWLKFNPTEMALPEGKEPAVTQGKPSFNHTRWDSSRFAIIYDTFWVRQGLLSSSRSYNHDKAFAIDGMIFAI
jgi:hypothetical protein